MNEMKQGFEPENIQIPECGCSACCGECRYMSRTDSNKFGEYWCGKRDRYYDPASSACGDFEY